MKKAINNGQVGPAPSEPSMNITSPNISIIGGNSPVRSSKQNLYKKLSVVERQIRKTEDKFHLKTEN